MKQLYQKITQLKVLKHFFDNPAEKYYLRETARLLRMSPATLMRALDLLVSAGLLVREEAKNQILYSANTESLVYRFSKIAHNLAWLEECKVVEHLLREVEGISSIVLYGSFAKGENDKHSDLDVLIISTTKKMESSDIGEKLGVEANITNFNATSWTEQAKTNRAFYLDVITEGIVLFGTRPVVA